MSGGSMDYLYQRVEDVADELQRSPNPRRAIFGHHLALVAKALHDIEWVDSGDSSPGYEHDAIELCVLSDAWAAVEARIAGLKAELERLEGR
jgi:hypothetical protein